MPSWSMASQLSTTFPSSEKRKMPMPVTLILALVAGRPRNSPVWVASNLQRVSHPSSFPDHVFDHVLDVGEGGAVLPDELLDVLRTALQD